MPHTEHSVRRVPAWLVAVTFALVIVGWLSFGAAVSRATTFSNTSSIALNDPNSQNNAYNNATATPYPSTISVSGLSGTVSSVSLSLNNVSYNFSDDIDALLVGPTGANLIVLAAVGPNTGASEAASNSTLTISDSGTLPTDVTAWGSAPTFKPVNFGSYGLGNSVNGFNETYPSPAPPAPWGDPGQNGANATLGNTFDGSSPNGTWSLYVITTSAGDGTGSIAGGWTLNITTASAASTTTSLGSSNNPSFTSSPNNSVTLTATVSSTSTVSEGTVDFTDDGSTISGCGAEPVSNGTATCTTSFSTEGDHSLEAQYSGTSNFGPSSGTLTQEVNDHTTVTGNSYCNTGSIALNNPSTAAADASPYPSRVFASGLTGTLSDLTVTLKGASYSESQDIDALLVGPQGQSLILAADAGPNSGGAISNVTMTLDDAATSTLSQTAIWGAANSTVTSKPFNYGGLNETWGSPAPSGPYGNPGPNGGGTATLASSFDGTNPNGTWSLYLITTSAGDGTGSVAGGWCANITTANVPATTTTLGSDNNPSFTSAPNNSVTLTATVTSTSTVSEGTVDFTDGGVTISGCGAEPVGNGTATCTTSFSTEGDHSLEALYSGTANFAESNGTLTQEVDDHTTVSGNSFCNTGSVALNNPSSGAADASPYPSHVFVSGKAGDLSDLTVTLKGATYGESQDIDALLVGPQGQSLMLVAAAGPNSGGAMNNVTLTLDDAASSTLSQTAVWGAANSTVTSKPVNYGGFNETWGSPAPSGPYGNPGPNGGGSATLGSTFDGTNPNGTWSLYVITTSAGDGTGSIAGGWCVTPTVPKTTLTIGTQVSPASMTIGNSASDTATLSGVPNGAPAPTGTVTFNAYGPGDATCSNAPAFTAAIPLAGAGTSASSGAFTPTTAGTYRWTASYGGDSNYSSVTTSCNDANETLAVSTAAPSLTTTASSGVTIGGNISDSAVLSGGVNPTGTITFSAYGPNDLTCSNSPAFTDTVTVSGNGTYGSTNFTPTTAGAYEFVATYGGDTYNASAGGSCGAANSTVVVTQTTTQTTLASSLNPAILGQAVTFTATVTGANPTGTVTFMDGATTLGAGSVGQGGVAMLTTSTLSAAGHSITAVYGGDANNAGSTSNVVTEVVTAPPVGAPSVSIASPTSGGRYRYGQIVRARYSCTDGTNGPGIQSCTGPVPDGAAIDTSTPGAHTFTVKAVSKDGQSTTKSVSYMVSQNNQFTVSEVIAHANGTVTFKLKAPSAGVVNVLETAWLSNVAHASSLLQPARGRFVFARARVSVRRAGSITVTVKPNSAGRKLLAHHTFSPVLRLWLSFTPIGGPQRNFGFYGLHLPRGPSAAEKCVPANLPGRLTHEPLRCAPAPSRDPKTRT